MPHIVMTLADFATQSTLVSALAAAPAGTDQIMITDAALSDQLSKSQTDHGTTVVRSAFRTTGALAVIGVDDIDQNRARHQGRRPGLRRSGDANSKIQQLATGLQSLQAIKGDKVYVLVTMP